MQIAFFVSNAQTSLQFGKNIDGDWAKQMQAKYSHLATQFLGAALSQSEVIERFANKLNIPPDSPEGKDILNNQEMMQGRISRILSLPSNQWRLSFLKNSIENFDMGTTVLISSEDPESIILLPFVKLATTDKKSSFYQPHMLKQET